MDVTRAELLRANGWTYVGSSTAINGTTPERWWQKGGRMVSEDQALAECRPGKALESWAYQI